MTKEEAYLKALELYQKTYAGTTPKAILFGSSTYGQVLEIANWLLDKDEEEADE